MLTLKERLLLIVNSRGRLSRQSATNILQSSRSTITRTMNDLVDEGAVVTYDVGNVCHICSNEYALLNGITQKPKKKAPTVTMQFENPDDVILCNLHKRFNSLMVPVPGLA